MLTTPACIFWLHIHVEWIEYMQRSQGALYSLIKFSHSVGQNRIQFIYVLGTSTLFHNYKVE